MPAYNEYRNSEIFRRWSAGEKQVDLASEFGISQNRVSEIVSSIKARFARPRLDLVAEFLDESDRIRARLAEIAANPLAPAILAGKDGVPVPVVDEDGHLMEGVYARDISAQTDAMRGMVHVQAHVAKLLGLNAPDKQQVDATVHYVLEGVDVEKDL